MKYEILRKNLSKGLCYLVGVLEYTWASEFLETIADRYCWIRGNSIGRGGLCSRLFMHEAKNKGKEI